MYRRKRSPLIETSRYCSIHYINIDFHKIHNWARSRCSPTQNATNMPASHSYSSVLIRWVVHSAGEVHLVSTTMCTVPLSKNRWYAWQVHCATARTYRDWSLLSSPIGCWDMDSLQTHGNLCQSVVRASYADWYGTIVCVIKLNILQDSAR